MLMDRKRSSLNKSLPKIERSISPLMKYKKQRYDGLYMTQRLRDPLMMAKSQNVEQNEIIKSSDL